MPKPIKPYSFIFFDHKFSTLPLLCIYSFICLLSSVFLFLFFSIVQYLLSYSVWRGKINPQIRILPEKEFSYYLANTPMALTILKRHMEEAQLVLEKLGQAMEGMDFSKSDVKEAAPSASILFDAFESKTQSDSLEAEKKSVAENRSPAADPLALMRRYMGDLKEVLNQMASDVDAFPTEAYDRALKVSYSQDLQSAKPTVLELEKRVAMVEDERNLWEQRVKELQDKEKIRSLSDVLSAKNQEIEAPMQALDEEEDHGNSSTITRREISTVMADIWADGLEKIRETETAVPMGVSDPGVRVPDVAVSSDGPQQEILDSISRLQDLIAGGHTRDAAIEISKQRHHPDFFVLLDYYLEMVLSDFKSVSVMKILTVDLAVDLPKYFISTFVTRCISHCIDIPDLAQRICFARYLRGIFRELNSNRVIDDSCFLVDILPFYMEFDNGNF